MEVCFHAHFYDNWDNNKDADNNVWSVCVCVLGGWVGEGLAGNDAPKFQSFRPFLNVDVLKLVEYAVNYAHKERFWSCFGMGWD